MVTQGTFNFLSGTGITFTNLFHGWPQKKIASIHQDSVPPSTGVCTRYYKLTEREFPYGWPYSLKYHFRHYRQKNQNALPSSKSVYVSVMVEKKSLIYFIKKILAIPKQFIFGDVLPERTILSEELKTWIEDYKPEVLYTILGSLSQIRLVRKIVEKYRLPLVIHMMDDWPSSLYRKGLFDIYRRHAMKRELKSLLKLATRCLSISDIMAEKFLKRYSVPFTTFHNAVDGDEWKLKSRKNWKRGNPFIMIYAGAIMQNSQLQSVADTADAVASLFQDGKHIKFDIYAPWYMSSQYREVLERPGCVSVSDAPDNIDITNLFSKADLLLLPVNFDRTSIRFIRYSMPTKVPAYMFSGTPTLAYGPAHVASIDYALNYQWAYCVTKRDQKLLANAIRQLYADENLRASIARRAYLLACERHDQKNVIPLFHRVFALAAKEGTIRR